MALGVVVGSMWKDSWLMIGLTAFGAVVKGWNEFKKVALKMDMCWFAYTMHDKTLIELRTYVHGFPLEGFDGFRAKLQTMDYTITDLTPPPPHDRLVKLYDQIFQYDPIPPGEHKWKVTSECLSHRRGRDTTKGGQEGEETTNRLCDASQ